MQLLWQDLPILHNCAAPCATHVQGHLLSGIASALCIFEKNANDDLRDMPWLHLCKLRLPQRGHVLVKVSF